MARIVVVGGTGLIGAKAVAQLKAAGEDAVAASPSTGVNALTGEGLAEVLRGADVVVDTTRPPSASSDAEVLAFFTSLTHNLLDAARAAGVHHYVALTIVGTGGDQQVPYYTAKAAEEDLVRAGGLPYTLVHATQFFEFYSGIADVSTNGETVRLPGVRVQPLAGDDAATAVVRAATSPAGGDIEAAGPERMRLDEFVRQGLAAAGDPRAVIRDDAAPYFRGSVGVDTLVPADDALIFDTHFADWLAARA